MSNDSEERKPDSFTPEEPEPETLDDKADVREGTGLQEMREAQKELSGERKQETSGQEELDPDESEDLEETEEPDESGVYDADDIQDDIEFEGEAARMSGSTKKKRRRRRRKGSMGKKPWIIAGSIAGALLVIYLVISAFFIGHFYIDTEINGQDFSGKTVADVENYIKEQVQDYELNIIEQNNESDVIKGSDISLTYKENEEIQKALDAQNPLLWPKAI